MARVCAEPNCPDLAADGRHCGKHKRKPWTKDTRRRGSSGWEWQRTVARILKRDHHVCRWCNGHATTADHVKAVADGGTDDDSNLVAACHDCNDMRRKELLASRKRPHTPLREIDRMRGARPGPQETSRTG